MQWLHKEHFMTDITDRRVGESWEADGKKSVVDRAREKVARIMKEHEVAPVAPEVAQQFEEIVKKADADISANGLD
jgi:trimethylamine--corrinoid protein Co-methyltransferase